MEDNKCAALKLDLKVGYSCDNNCVHCVISDNKKALLDAGKRPDLTTDECMDQINSTKSRGISWITFTGGEPSIRSDFIHLLRQSHEQGLNITIQSNGRGFHAPDLCKQLKGLNIKKILIAIHGPNPEIHDRITQKKNSFNETIQAIKNLIDMGFNVHGKIVISRINSPYLVDILNLLHSIGVKNACFAFPHALGSARINFAEVMPRYKEIRPEIDMLIQRSKELNFNLELEAFTFCTLSDPMFADEMVQLRPMQSKTIPVGEEEYDWDTVRKLIKTKFPQCKACSFDRICEGPWKEYPEAFGAAEFQPLLMEAYLDFLTRGVDKTC
jgi:MoaA/NifB/PqqE/SkfB family radical SAM enzyme